MFVVDLFFVFALQSVVRLRALFGLHVLIERGKPKGVAKLSRALSWRVWFV